MAGLARSTLRVLEAHSVKKLHCSEQPQQPSALYWNSRFSKELWVFFSFPTPRYHNDERCICPLNSTRMQKICIWKLGIIHSLGEGNGVGSPPATSQIWTGVPQHQVAGRMESSAEAERSAQLREREAKKGGGCLQLLSFLPLLDLICLSLFLLL